MITFKGPIDTKNQNLFDYFGNRLREKNIKVKMPFTATGFKPTHMPDLVDQDSIDPDKRTPVILNRMKTLEQQQELLKKFEDDAKQKKKKKKKKSAEPEDETSDDEDSDEEESELEETVNKEENDTRRRSELNLLTKAQLVEEGQKAGLDLDMKSKKVEMIDFILEAE